MTPESFASAHDALRHAAPLRELDDGAIGTLHDVMQARRVAAGTCLVREGDDDRAMFVLLDGCARVEREGVELGIVEPGESFGELALVVGGKRSASVLATADTTVLVLDEHGFEALVERAPRLAVELLRRVVATTSERLLKMNETTLALLASQGLPRRIDIPLSVLGEPRVVRNGTSLGALLPYRIEGAPVVAALVDGRARPLDAAVSGGCELGALTTRHWEGERIFRQSAGLAVLEAAEQLGWRLAIGPSLGFAWRLLLDDASAGPDAAARLQQAFDALVRADVPLQRERLTPLEASEHFRRAGWDETVHLLQTTPRQSVALASYGRVYVPTSGPLLPRTGGLGGCSIHADAGGLLLLFPHADRVGAPAPEEVAHAREVSARIASMTATQERWLEILGVRSVGAFNRAAIDGEVGELIRVAEGFHEKRIGQIADAIAARADALRVVVIAGPSSSGKTTFIRRLRVQLQVAGLRPVGLGLDDYYVDREATPRAADGDFDFEALEALRLDLLRDHLQRLVRGEAVRTARYDFRSGRSDPEGGPLLRLGAGDLLLVEGIHGLNPALAPALPPESVFRVFVCPLIGLPRDRHGRVHTSDVRLLRRIVRDRHGRALDAAETIRRWPAVRAGERRHIFPYQQFADAVFDTGLVYEPSVLKVFAERYLLEVPDDDPAQATAERLLALLGEWVTIYPEHVPPTSLLREFIGGSGFGD